MKKKIVCLLVIFAIICMCIGFQFTYADTIYNKVAKSEILSSSSLEITKDSTFDLNIDLTKITFENFKIQLTSNINLETPSLEVEETKKEDLKTDVDAINNLLEITASKTDLNLDNLTLNYKLPESISVGNSVQFVLKASSTAEGEDADTTVIENSITFTAIEKNNDNSENNNNSNVNTGNTNNGEQNSNSPITNGNLENSSNKPLVDSSFTGNSTTGSSSAMQNFSVSLDNFSTSSKSSTQVSGMNTTSALSSNIQAVTYDGSDNNYLSALAVDGYNFSNSFSKTTSTFFVTVPEGTTSLNVSASTEDSTASICVYGDSDLASGNNKLLVSVTAENGSVRTYRIYVTVK